FSLASRRCSESMVRRNSATVCSRSASSLRATVALALAVTVHGLSGRGVVPVPGLQRGGDSRAGQHRFGKRLFQFVFDFGVRFEELCYAALRASLVRPGDSSGFICERQWVPPLLRSEPLRGTLRLIPPIQPVSIQLSLNAHHPVTQ